MKIKTRDLWQSAFVLAKGGELAEVAIEGQGRRKPEAVFILRGPEVEELVQEFRSGQALCNIAQFRASMIHLKEQMFWRMRVGKQEPVHR